MDTNLKLHALITGFKNLLYDEFKKSQDELREMGFFTGFNLFIDKVAERMARDQLDEWPEHVKRTRDMEYLRAKSIAESLSGETLEDMGLEEHFEQDIYGKE